MLVFELWIQTDCEKIPPAKEFVPANEGQAAAEIVRVKHFDSLPEVRRKESSVLKIAMEPERAGVKLNLIDSNAELIGHPDVGPLLVPILRNRQWIRL